MSNLIRHLLDGESPSLDVIFSSVTISSNDFPSLQKTNTLVSLSDISSLVKFTTVGALKISKI